MGQATYILKDKTWSTKKCLLISTLEEHHNLALQSYIWSLLTSVLAAATAAKLLQLCPTLCDPIDGSSPGSFVHGILQEGILRWVAIPFSRGSSQPRDIIHISYFCIGTQVLYHQYHLGSPIYMSVCVYINTSGSNRFIWRWQDWFNIQISINVMWHINSLWRNCV